MSTKKNFIYNLSYQILIIVIPLITTPYISRIIGAEGTGIQSYTYSIANYFVLFAMLGIKNHGNRSIAMNRDNRKNLSETFWGIYLIQCVMSLIMIAAYIIYILFFVNEYKIIFLIQLIYIISALLDINWFFFGIEQFKLTVIRNMIIKIISVISIFILVKSSRDLYIYSLILALSNLVSQVVLWRFIFKYVNFTPVKIKSVLQHVKPIMILFIPVIAISMYKMMDKIMLGSMSDIIQVGFYENSEKIINIPMGIITALATVMLPKMSNLQAKGDTKSGERYLFMSIEFVMFIGVGSMFGLIGVSSVLIPIFLGESFLPCINIVSLLSVTIFIIGWANVIRTQVLIPKSRDKVYIISTILGATLNLTINILLIRRFGAIGATIGTIVAEAGVAIYQSFVLRKELNIDKYLKRCIFYFIPGAIMCIVIKYIGSTLGISIFTGLIQIIVGGIIYVSISFIYMIIVKSELVVGIMNSLSYKYNKIFRSK